MAYCNVNKEKCLNLEVEGAKPGRTLKIARGHR